MSDYARKTISIIRVIVLIICGFELYLRITTGRPTSHLLLVFLLLTAPFKIYDNHIAPRKNLEGDAEALRNHNKIVRRSVVLAVLIVTVVAAAAVVSAVYF